MVDRPPNLRTLPGGLHGARAANAAPEAAPRAAPRIAEEPLHEPLVVLSGDASLIAELKRIAAPRPVRTVDRDADLSLTLREVPTAVTVLDSAYVTRAPLPRLTARLKLQFPDLAVVVLALPPDYRELADQLARDTIYGLLEKPAQPQRLQQMLARAWLRHEAASQGWAAPAQRAGLRQHWRLALIAAGLIAAIAGGAYALRTFVGAAPVAATAPQPVESPAAQLLTRADAALAAGAYENAAELYRRAQQIAPADPRVQQGVAVLMRRLLTGAQAQLLDQHLDRAQALARLAVEVQPDNPLVTGLVTQISALQVRAAASQGPLTALSLEDLLPHAVELMRQGHLLDPPQDNARDALGRARQLAPNDPRISPLQKQLVALMLAAGRRAAAAGHPEEVLRYVAPVQELGAPSSEVARLESSSRSSPASAPLEQLEAAFNKALEQGKLVQPAADSAKGYLGQLLKISPGSPVSQAARLALGQRLAAEAQSAARRKDLPGARRWLSEAREAGVDARSIVTIEAIVAGASGTPAKTVAKTVASPRSGASAAPGALEQLRYVDPVYPPAASSHRVKGSVEVQFTVRRDGTTGDLTVISAKPTGVFEQAALTAVRQWRYRPPVLNNGAPTEVRAVVKLDFAPY